MMEKAHALKWVELYGANLVGNDKWIDMFVSRGKDLETLKLSWLDAAFDDQAMEAMVEFCPNVSRLKLKRCRQLGVETLEALCRAQNLRHLSLQLSKEIPEENLVELVSKVGLQLRTLSLEGFSNAPDEVLAAIHDNCRNLEDPEEQIGSRFELETLRRPAIATCYRLPRWK
jgi:DNA repair protein RAD7